VFTYSSFSIFFLNLGINTVLRFQSLFKVSYPIVNFFGSIINLSHCKLVVILSLFIFKLKVLLFSISLDSLIILPIFYSFLKPFLHKASISLKLIDLSSSYFLLNFFLSISFILVILVSILFLMSFFFFIFIKMLLHVYLLLRFVQLL
jgi:hypothetical protein